MAMSPLTHALRCGLAISSLICAWLVVNAPASASGPVERLRQVLVHPSAPDVIVVRYAVPDGASHGFLFSRDKGKSFQGLCSQAATPDAPEEMKLKRISNAKVPGTAAVVLDSMARVVFSQIDGLWSDDGTGCTWSETADPLIAKNWPYSVILDPKDPTALLSLVTTRSTDYTESHAELMRRDPSGAWSVIGALKPTADQTRTLGTGLIANDDTTRLYASATYATGALNAQSTLLMLTSEDGGKTWREVGPAPTEQSGESFVLLAVDPQEPKRVLAVMYRDSAADTLLISDDEGKTFNDYMSLTETSGVAFGPDGHLYVADAGDDSSADTMGGLWTTAKMGDPLTKVGATHSIDCLGFAPGGSELFVCMRKSFGSMDPATGTYQEITAIDQIPSLLKCPGYDTEMACETQLNAGASWCCAGHYPFTPFCGDYNVTEAAGRPVLCGVPGREYDQSAGNGPPDASVASDGGATSTGDAGSAGSVDAGDAGTSTTKKDAGTSSTSHSDAGDDDSSPSKSGGGCAVPARQMGTESAGGALASIGFLLIAFGRTLRRRARQ